MSFGYIVKSLRTQRGWSQEELAFRVGATAATVSRLETGKHGVGDPLKLLIAKEFGLKVSELIALTESEQVITLEKLPESEEDRLVRYFQRMGTEKRALFLSIGSVFAKAR